jgi:hypothetical protein
MPKRIQRKRTKGWRMPENAVYVGRPTKYGNRFSVGEIYTEAKAVCRDFTYSVSKDMVGQPLSREDAVKLYKHLITNDDFGTPLYLEWVEDLRGKDLACWCPLDKPCHADVLLRLANPTCTGTATASETAAGEGK